MKKPFLLLVLSILVYTGYAQTPTWAQDIAPIFYKNCTSCHHKGGLAPFTLITYASAKANLGDIRDEVTNKTMPPWPPDPHYSRLAEERILSPGDIKKIQDWVDGGGLMGDTSQAPTPPVYTNGSALGTPDLSLTIPTFKVPANQTEDIYQCFVLPSGLSTEQFITALEIVPGNPSIVHHVLIYQDTTGTCQQLDNNFSGPGYRSFGGIGTNNAILLGGWVPGARPFIFPDNMGIKIQPGSDIVIQVHYPLGSENKSDSTTLNLKLASNLPREVLMIPALNHYTNISPFPLRIPANETKSFTEHLKLPFTTDVSILTVGPHCHLLGKEWSSYAITPGGDTIPFIRINNWDFNWQGFYAFRNVLKVPAGSDLYAHCLYDNTTNNPNNPNNPPKVVNVGEATTDEMMLVYFSFLLYNVGDENIVIDSTELVNIEDPGTAIDEIENPIVSTPQLYEASPNPANNETIISYFLPSTNTPTELKIYDLKGGLVETVRATNLLGHNKVTYNTSKLAAGTYIYSLHTGQQVKSKQLIIAK